MKTFNYTLILCVIIALSQHLYTVCIKSFCKTHSIAFTFFLWTQHHDILTAYCSIIIQITKLNLQLGWLFSCFLGTNRTKLSPLGQPGEPVFSSGNLVPQSPVCENHVHTINVKVWCQYKCNHNEIWTQSFLLYFFWYCQCFHLGHWIHG
jgi:hypothetical protein